MPPKVSGKAVKKSGKAAKAMSKGGDKKKKKLRRKESYAIYIYKVREYPIEFAIDIQQCDGRF